MTTEKKVDTEESFDLSTLNPEQREKFVRYIQPLAEEAMHRFRELTARFMALGNFIPSIANIGDEELMPKLYTALEKSLEFHGSLTNYLETLHCMSTKAVGLGLAHVSVPEQVKEEDKSQDKGEFKFNMKLTKE